MPKNDIHVTYMRIATEIASLSYAVKKQVGCIIVKGGRIVSTGYNGMPQGFPNTCEFNPEDGESAMTKDEVIHAEMNAIAFAARNGQSTDGCDIYITCMPCIECAKVIIQAGIKRVFYSEKYRKENGHNLLVEAKIPMEWIELK